MNILSKQCFKYGFTVVELLIVVVMIGILVTVGTFAYNGVTTRSRNTQVAVVIEKYSDALVVYHSK